MAKQPREKEPVNIVHQNDILCETIRKEVRNQKLYTNYSVNPYKKSKCFELRQGDIVTIMCGIDV